MTLNEIKTWDGILRGDDKPPINSLTTYIEMDSCYGDFVAMWISPDTDTNDSFKGVCADTGEIIAINGWLGHVTKVKEFDQLGKLKSINYSLFV